MKCGNKDRWPRKNIEALFRESQIPPGVQSGGNEWEQKGLLQIYKQLEGDYRKCGHCIEKDKGSGDKGHGERLAVSHSLLVRSSSAIPAQDQWRSFPAGKTYIQWKRSGTGTQMGHTEEFKDKFKDNLKLKRVADTPDSCVAIQKDLDGLEKWADRNPVKFNKGQRKV